MGKYLPQTLLLGQLVAMLSVVPLFMYATPWQLGITFAIYACIMSSITILYHRLLSHRSFVCPAWLEFTMAFFAHIMMVGPAIVWVANHREHHKYTDTELDPHSPYYRGVFRAYFLQVMAKIDFSLCRDMLRNKRYRLQVAYYWPIIFFWAYLLFVLYPFALIYAWLAPAGLAKLIGSLVFTYSHRNRQAHSDIWVGLITFGEGFHAPHHADPRKVLWHPLDIGGQLIRLIDRNAKV